MNTDQRARDHASPLGVTQEPGTALRPVVRSDLATRFAVDSDAIGDFAAAPADDSLVESDSMPGCPVGQADSQCVW
jgi:hypothetical protein